ncbi:LAMI_0A07162g1_1 [Lachancea mirantina]|uniref:LAMI_0A07162g1_1 n=1 Tax=Lachancea mirantina TaxID=1230905 RepID=A0A1G4IQP7_9SACH|nr:LAMI_0A07162g1_1 [Lachancea mirantina]
MTNTPTPSGSVDATKVQPIQRVSDDDLYRHSSQYRMWSFTPEQLAQKRVEINARAATVLETRVRSFLEQNPDLGSDEVAAITEKAVPVTADEEVLLVNYFARMLLTFATKMNLPTEVAATAVTFFRRFYLNNSVMDIVPKEIFYTTLFFACKSENFFIGIDSFAKKTKSKNEDVLKYEFRLLESLQFTLMNHHPFKALHGFFLDIQNILQGKVDLNYMGQVYTNCKKTIMEAILTDVVYFYSPPQITLAALLKEDEALAMRYLDLKFANEDSPGVLHLETLRTVIVACKDTMSANAVPSKEQATRTVAKIHFGQNPLSVVERMRRQRESASPP